MKKSLAIFDFDGTIANVPERPQQGMDHRGWNGRDWWASHQSLCTHENGGFYSGSVNTEVIEAFHKAVNNSQTDTVMLTGRRSPIAYAVRRILREQGLLGTRIIDPSKKNELKYHLSNCHLGKDQEDEGNYEQYFCGDVEVTNGIHGTFGHKREVLDRKMKANGGSYERIDIWDDRIDHIEMFMAMGRELIQHGKVQEIVIHRVFAPVGDAEAVVIHIPVTVKSHGKQHG
jgi:hypothetical protein